MPPRRLVTFTVLIASTFDSALAAYQRSAVPFNVVWLPGKTTPVLLPEILTPAMVLDAVK